MAEFACRNNLKDILTYYFDTYSDSDSDDSPCTDSSCLSLLDLPDPCLLAVMQCCVDDPLSLFSAARAHSRLHRFSMAAIHSSRQITARITQYQQASSLLAFLVLHGEHVDNLCVWGAGNIIIRPSLPHNLQLEGLQCDRLKLQFMYDVIKDKSVLGMSARTINLKKLRLSSCTLLAGADDLAAALSLLPGLEHLSLQHIQDDVDGKELCFPTGVIELLQQLTFLELDVLLYYPNSDLHVLQPLQALTRLADLRLVDLPDEEDCTSTSILSGACCLTRLVLEKAVLESGALAGKTLLQHLQLDDCTIMDGAAQLLPHLQCMMQLTHLNLKKTLHVDYHPVAAFSALTASTKLQYLSTSKCKLPRGARRHMFPAGRQLPHLQCLDITGCGLIGRAAAAPDGSSLVSCCPGLCVLAMGFLQYSRSVLVPLLGLSNLHTLRLNTAIAEFTEDEEREGLDVICQLTQLRQLELRTHSVDLQWLQLTQLKGLTRLDYGSERRTGCFIKVCFVQQGTEGEPVWRQVLRHQWWLVYRKPRLAYPSPASP